MKNFLWSGVFVSILMAAHPLLAQKFGYIDTNSIIKKLPEYKEAEEQIEKLTEGWLEEISEMRNEVEGMQARYRVEEVLMTPEMRKERQIEIQKKREELQRFQNNAFGYEGLLYLKRQELMRPLQEKIAEAAQTVARKKGLQFLFDKAADIVMIYADPKHNYTDFVLEELDLGDPADTEQ